MLKRLIARSRKSAHGDSARLTIMPIYDSPTRQTIWPICRTMSYSSSLSSAPSCCSAQLWLASSDTLEHHCLCLSKNSYNSEFRVGVIHNKESGDCRNTCTKTDPHWPHVVASHALLLSTDLYLLPGRAVSTSVEGIADGDTECQPAYRPCDLPPSQPTY